MRGFDLVFIRIWVMQSEEIKSQLFALFLFSPLFAFIHLPLYLPIICAVLAVTESFPINSVAMEKFPVSVPELLEGLIGLQYLLWSGSELIY